MCGRYALALRPSEIRQMLQDDGLEVDDAPEDAGDGAPRSSYNFAPGYHGVVYRADTPDRGAGPQHGDRESQETSTMTSVKSGDSTAYKLQSMKWGLIPSWTKRNPDYGSMLKTINCRDDSLSSPGGLWASMKARKRCIVIAQGFYEWLKSGKEKLPHYVKRKDGRLMCFAGLWDCVQYEGSEENLYTYTIITTDSNPQLKFLHTRMPVILEPQSPDITSWLNPSQDEWSDQLQSLLGPFEGALEIYPVSKDVGKVGNNSPAFIVPLDSKENKSNIKNFFNVAGGQKPTTTGEQEEQHRGIVKEEENHAKPVLEIKKEPDQFHKSPAAKRKVPEGFDTERNDSDDDTKKAQSRVSAVSNKKKIKQDNKKRKGEKITRYFNTV